MSLPEHLIQKMVDEYLWEKDAFHRSESAALEQVLGQNNVPFHLRKEATEKIKKGARTNQAVKESKKPVPAIVMPESGL